MSANKVDKAFASAIGRIPVDVVTSDIATEIGAGPTYDISTGHFFDTASAPYIGIANSANPRNRRNKLLPPIMSVSRQSTPGIVDAILSAIFVKGI
ncbi:MAG: hypothetical protein ABJP02_14315 [Parasphingorhabdus sp.]|uniref:hypothetical protein n=1 Tax=Parasphingorhabdus sp. TaxID=2709688 RepID=UPI003298D696